MEGGSSPTTPSSCTITCRTHWLNKRQHPQEVHAAQEHQWNEHNKTRPPRAMAAEEEQQLNRPRKTRPPLAVCFIARDTCVAMAAVTCGHHVRESDNCGW